ncbi:hypothetical protein Tco_0271285 [Tanacetum coccineum]
MNLRLLFLQEVILFTMSSPSQENVHANQSSVIESLPVSPIPVEDSESAQEEIDIFLVLDDLIPSGVENDDFEDEDNELPNLDHQDDPSISRPPSEPPDVEKCFEPEVGLNQQFLKPLVCGIVSRITRASYPLFEISLGDPISFNLIDSRLSLHNS